MFNTTGHIITIINDVAIAVSNKQSQKSTKGTISLPENNVARGHPLSTQNFSKN